MKLLLDWALRKPAGVVDTYFDTHERRQVLQAVLVGVAVWALVHVLKLAVHEAFHLLHAAVTAPGWPVPALVLVPLVVGALVTSGIAHWGASTIRFRDAHGTLHPLNDVEGDGLERAIALYFSAEPSDEDRLRGEERLGVRWRQPTFSLAFRKTAATLATLGSGGSGGLEASVTLIGESVAAGLFKPRPLGPLGRSGLRPLERLARWWRASDTDDLQAAQLCGIAAAVATLVEAPFASAFFAVEVMYRRRPIVDKLLQALMASMTAFFLTHFAGGGAPLLAGPFERPPVYAWRYYVALVAVAVTIAAVAIYFRQLRAALDRFFHARFRRPPTRHVAGALATGALAIAVAAGLLGLERVGLAAPGSDDLDALELVLGTGEQLLQALVAGEVLWPVALLALVGRLHASLTTITSGGAAGLLFPTMSFGALVAVAWGAVFPEYPVVTLVAPAMTASLVSIANVPLAAILLVVETFGAGYVVPALFMMVATSILAYDNHLYRTQREAFDGRQILPGVSVRRVRVPAAWEGRTLADLALRRAHRVTAVGMVDRSTSAEGGYTQRPLLHPRPDQPLTEGDLLVVLGEDGDLEGLEVAIGAAERGPVTDAGERPGDDGG